jgi:hypothetical protein
MATLATCYRRSCTGPPNLLISLIVIRELHMIVRNFASVRSRRASCWTSPLLAGTAAVLLAVGSSANGAAQSPDATRLQAETNALNAQMRSLESKMLQLKTPPAPVPDPGSKDPTDTGETSFFADKKLHLGGITITPGGFIEAGGLRRQ